MENGPARHEYFEQATVASWTDNARLQGDTPDPPASIALSTVHRPLALHFIDLFSLSSSHFSSLTSSLGSASVARPMR